MTAPPGTALSTAGAKYLNSVDHTLDMSVAEAEELGLDLAKAITDAGLRPELIVGIANGAFLPATVVAEALGIPLEMVKVRRKGSRYKQRLLVIKKLFRIPSWLILWGPLRPMWVLFQKKTATLEEDSQSFSIDVAGKSVVIVDDCIETGVSLKYVADKLRASGAKVQTAVYCWSQMPDVDDNFSRPDIHLHRHVQLYPWSYNSEHLADFEQWMKDRDIAVWT